jgi:hypothetical protein
VVQEFGDDFERALEFLRAFVENAAQTLRARRFQPALITDKGSAFIPRKIFFGKSGPKMADFVRAIGASFAVVFYGTAGRSRKEEMFHVLGTDGRTFREISVLATRKRGSTTVELHEEKEDTVPWEHHFLGDVARALRENNDAGATT